MARAAYRTRRHSAHNKVEGRIFENVERRSWGRGGQAAGKSKVPLRWCVIGPRVMRFGHLNCMQTLLPSPESIDFRVPAEPAPPPIREPDPPENPDVPIREPEPNEPGEI